MSSQEQPTESPSPQKSVAKFTLSQFIEDNSKLITSVAAFVALTAFSSQLDNGDIKILFPALTFLAAALLSFELLRKLPAPPRHWRLEAFSLILANLVLLMGWYWLSKFPVVWVPTLGYLVEIVLFIGLAVLLTRFFSKVTKVIAAKLFKREIRTDAMLRVPQFWFVFCMVLALMGLLWASRKLANRPIKIHIPVISQNTD